MVREMAVRRRLVAVGGSIDYDARDLTKEVGATLELAEQEIFSLGQGRSLNNYRSAQQVIKSTIKLIEERKDSKKEYTGLPTRFTELDAMLSGLQKSEMIVIGARPSMGKTALALSMLDNIVGGSDSPKAGFFSLEMSEIMLMERLIAARARIESTRIKRPSTLLSKEWGALNDAAAFFFEAPIWFEDTPNISLGTLRSEARRMKAKEDIDVLFIDYLGLITVEERNLPRHEQMSLVSRSLKGLARELEIPVVVLSQLRRDAEGNEPNLADIRESGSIEQDADVVMFLHRKRAHEAESESDDGIIETQLIVAKNRNGPVGTSKLAFVPRFARFDNYQYGH
jgi:replicative DNA helicase